jgi:S1-C subfamily serine protease/rhodanese-related sulfurtransferase
MGSLRARLSWVGRLLLLTSSAALATPPSPSFALSVQEALLRAKPAVALVTAEVKATVTVSCGREPVTVTPSPFIEAGTAWFVDGRGFLITNAHVIDPAHRLPPWVVHDLKRRAIDEACVEPALRSRGLVPRQKPEIEEQIRRAIPLTAARLTTTAQITVLLSNGARREAAVVKFSPPITLDAKGQPLPDSGRDLALLRIQRGAYPALSLSERDPNLGDSVHILGYPGVVLNHELLDPSAQREATVTNGQVSGFNKDAIGQDVIQTDAAATYGNSGGPAVTDDLLVMGVMTFISLVESRGVQGFNFLIPARDVRAFLRGTDVRPGESRFNPVWAAGVTAWFEGSYAKALARFQEADRLVPGLVDVRRSMAEAREKIRHPPPRPFPWAWAMAGTVTVLSLGAWGALGGRRWWRNRYRIQPSQVIDRMGQGHAPLLLDTRLGTDYETSPLSLPGAVRLDPDQIAAGPMSLAADRQQLIVTFCTSPEERTSAHVARLLRRQGWRHVRVLKGGLGAWANARLPVETKSHLPSIGIEIYRSLTQGHIERRRYPAGAVIFEEGEDARGEAYVVHAGTIEIKKRVDGGERRLNLVNEGELLGEMALFRKAPRSASAVALTDAEILVVQNERLGWLIRNRPELTLELLKRLSDQIVSRDTDGGAPPGAPSPPPDPPGTGGRPGADSP